MRSLPSILVACAASLIALDARAAPPVFPDSPTTSGVLSAAIPAQPLSRALAEFARQTSLQVVYVSSLAAGRSSRPVAAGLTPGEALGQMLAGTGLRFEFLDARTLHLLGDHPAEPAHPPQRVGARSPVRPWQDRDAIEEVMVTATKREEALGVVPINATVLTAEEMNAVGVKGIADITALTPGVEYDYSTQWGPGILTNLAIRGISASKGAATTGLYIDDAPIQVPHSSFASVYPATFDLARVEVLRGPQGTLFGSSAEGGAIRFVTHEPSTTVASSLYRAEVSATESGGLGHEAGAALARRSSTGAWASAPARGTATMRAMSIGSTRSPARRSRPTPTAR